MELEMTCVITGREKMIVYRYFRLIADSCPRELILMDCPNCGNHLEEPGSITILMLDETEVQSSLESGVLQDTPDMRVARGDMEDVCCSKCANSLQENDEIDEEELRF
jgi:hypothetical protein